MNFMEQATFATEKAREYVNSASEAITKARSMVGGDSHYFSTMPKVDELRRSLDSDSLHEKRDTMKRIIAQMCKGNNMKHLFPDVVKNIHEPSIELRKLIYLFIVHYAEDCPNEALLSISAFQKDLVHSSMHVRSLALRMLSSLHIPAIHPVVMVAVQKCAQDVAPLVRKTAAIALLQLHSVSPDHTDLDSVKGILGSLLNDRNADVIGAAAMTFGKLCRRDEDMDVVHPVFTHLCSQLCFAEEIGQVFISSLLLRYARRNFCDPSKKKTEEENDKSKNDKVSSSESGSDSNSSSLSNFYRNSNVDKKDDGNSPLSELDSDLVLLLQSAKRLLRSTNSAVVLAACNLYIYCAPPNLRVQCFKPLLRLLVCGINESTVVALGAIYSLILSGEQTFFQKSYRDFFLNPDDNSEIYVLKLRILPHLVSEENINDILEEFKVYVKSFNANMVVEAIRGLKLLLMLHSKFSSRVIRVLNPLYSEENPFIVSESIGVLRLLVVNGQDTEESTKHVFRLMDQVMKEQIVAPVAVSSVLWLVGENIRAHAAIAGGAPDCFRMFLKKFPFLDSSVKKELLILGCKIWMNLKGGSELSERFKEMFFFALQYAAYDEDYTVQDLGRLLECTKEREGKAFEMVSSALSSAKPHSHFRDSFYDRLDLELGSLSCCLGFPVFDYEPLPEWAAVPTERTLRHPDKLLQPTSKLGSSASSFYSDDDDEVEDKDISANSGKSDTDSRQDHGTGSDHDASDSSGEDQEIDEESLSSPQDDESSSASDDKESSAFVRKKEVPAAARVKIVVKSSPAAQQ